MKAIRMHKTGGPEVIVMEEIDTPVLAPDSEDVLVKVERAGVNYSTSIPTCNVSKRIKKKTENYPTSLI